MKIWTFCSTLLLSACASFKGEVPFGKPETLFYKHNHNQRQSGELYLPIIEKDQSYKLITVVHGGGWSGRDFNDMNSIAKSLASHGYIVFNINYRLSPEFKHPSAVEDVRDAHLFIQQELKSRGVSISKSAFWGYSSGAHLISYVALTETKKNPSFVSVVVAGGSPMELTRYPDSPYVLNYLGGYSMEKPREYIEASPINHIHEKAPAFFLYHSRSDALVEYTQSSEFQFRLKQKNISSEFYLVSPWGHQLAFAFSSEAVKKGILFLKKHL